MKFILLAVDDLENLLYAEAHDHFIHAFMRKARLSHLYKLKGARLSVHVVEGM